MAKIILMFALLISSATIAQKLVPFRKENGKFIYVDSATMNPVIKEEFINAYPFTEGRAVVYFSYSGRYYYWGHIDRLGQRVSSSYYTFANSFSEGFSSVGTAVDGQGYVDIFQRHFLMGKYSYPGSFSNNRAYVRKSSTSPYGYIDKKGNEVIPLKYENVTSFREGLAAVKLNGGWRIIDTSGNELAKLTCDYPVVFSEGLLTVKNGNKWSYVDKTGKAVFSQQYDEAKIFNEGLAAVKINDKWGYIDKNGKEVIGAKYEEAGTFSNGLAPVKKKGEWGYIDREENIKISFRYDAAYDFDKGFGYVGITKKSKTTYFYIDMAGREYREK